jgi:hypothetical protein
MPDDPEDSDDLDLHRQPPEEGGWSPPSDLPPPASSRSAFWLAGALALVLAAAAFWVLRPRPAAVIAPPPPAAPAPAPTATPTPFPLPTLDGSDAPFRDLARAVSHHPLFALWLARTELVRTAAAVVLNVAEGESPRPHLGFLAPKAGFAVIERRSGRLTIDPAGYARYDPVGDAVASLDEAECARVYRILEPLFEAAYRELGHPEGGFSGALARAFASLLAVPVVEGEVALVRVEKAVVIYELFDEKLEALSPAQKHLLRMGPRNVKRIQDKIRAVSEALGLASPPLPSPADRR